VAEKWQDLSGIFIWGKIPVEKLRRFRMANVAFE